jgi:Domain of unknown function (DUF4399)
MRTFFATIVVLFIGLMDGGAIAQQPAIGGPSPSPAGAKAYFVDLKDGAIIGPNVTVHFGLHGMGVAPAGTIKANTGHHHLLIDTELPPLDQPIPSDENHLHFGAGQTEVELNLPPGPHTLQLLVGDANHIPHSPPVMSELVHVTVSEAPPAPAAPTSSQSSGPHPSPVGAKVYFIDPRDGAKVPATFTVRFGLVGMGVAPAGVERANTGHHHLIIDAPLPPLDEPIPNDADHLHFGAGQTEAAITLAPGRHTLQLLLGDLNHVPHQPPVYSAPITVYAGVEIHRNAPPAPRPAVSRPVSRVAEPWRAPPPAVSPRADHACSNGFVRAANGGCEAVRDVYSNCQIGLHPVPAPTTLGYRCVLNGY